MRGEISKSNNYGAIVFSNESQHERGYIKFEHNRHDWDRARKIATENKLCLNLRENSSTWEWKYRDLPMWNIK